MVTIRLAKINEIDCLNHLIEQSARVLSQDDYSPEEIDGAVRYVFGVDIELVRDETYYVVEDDQKIVACGGWSKRKTLFGGSQFADREDGIYLDPTIDAAKIRAFFVHPQHSRKGYGRMLLRYCEQQARLQGFSACEMMATLPGVKLYCVEGYGKESDEAIVLPNGVSLRFVRMKKNILEDDLVRKESFHNESVRSLRHLSMYKRENLPERVEPASHPMKIGFSMDSTEKCSVPHQFHVP